MTNNPNSPSNPDPTPDPVDQKIIDFCLFMRELGTEEWKRIYASIYYEIGDVSWLMEEGWPNAVQHDYPKLIPEED